MREVDEDDNDDEEVRRSCENDGGGASRSESGGSAVAKEVMPLRFRSCRSGEMVWRGCLSGDAVDGGVTLLVAVTDSLWSEGSKVVSPLEIDACENELTLGVGGVNIGTSSVGFLLLETMSAIVEKIDVRTDGKGVGFEKVMCAQQVELEEQLRSLSEGCLLGLPNNWGMQD